MCTIALAWQLFDESPVAIGANREERFNRPAAGPAVLEREPSVYGPRDLEAGGTWLAVNDHGVYAAVTNRAGGPTGDRSRGWLVRDIANTQSAEAALDLAKTELGAQRYAGCNLLIVDRKLAIVLEWDGSIVERNLDPGIHVIVNEGIDEDVPKSAIVQARLQAPPLDSLSEWNARVKTILQDHGIGTCLHGTERGTRSSSVISRERDGIVRWFFADGPPCEVPYKLWKKSEL